MTHWKKLTNPDFIGAYELEQNERRVVTILSVAQELVTGADGKKEHCIVAKLQGQKPMILNKTNCKTISKIYDTPLIEEWAGKKITIYATKVKAFGEVVDALRIEAKLPELPELTPQHPKWVGAVQALKSGQVTLEQIKRNYKLSKENEQAIQN